MTANELDRKAYEIVERHIPSSLPMDTPFVWAIEAVLEALASPPVAVQEEGDAKDAALQPLTKTKVINIINKLRNKYPYPGGNGLRFDIELARAIEAAHGIFPAPDAMKGDKP